MDTVFCRLRIFSPVILVLVLVFGASCNSSDVPVYPVRGQVVVDGKPAELASVVFHPVGGSEEVQKLRPRATTGPDGYFSLMTFWHDDGAPAGQYKVTIVWPGPPPDLDSDAYHPEELSSRPDVLGGRYQDPETSGLQATVTKGKNELPSFVLETRAAER